MATYQVRYLTRRPGAPGGLPRYFWQPGPTLRVHGWRTQRVPLDWQRHTDAEALRAAAIAAAEELNLHLDATRAAQGMMQARAPEQPAARTVATLIAAFQASKDFTSLRATTQRGYRQSFNRIIEWAGDAPVRAIDAPRIQRFRRALARTPAVANAAVRVLRLVLSYGCREWGLATNPASALKLVGAPPSGLIWPRGAVAAFVAAADAAGRHSIGTAVLLNEWLGQRQSDIIRMPRSIYRNGSLVLRQSKGGVAVTLPIDMITTLRDRLQAEIARTLEWHRAAAARGEHHPMPAAIIINEETGQAYKPDNFRHLFAELRDQAAYPGRKAEEPRVGPGVSYEIDYLLPGRDMESADAFQVRMAELTFMHLRHTAVTRLSEAGSTSEQISAISGHSMTTVAQILERYMVRTAEIARGAFQKRLDAETPANTPATSKSHKVPH